MADDVLFPITVEVITRHLDDFLLYTQVLLTREPDGPSSPSSLS